MLIFVNRKMRTNFEISVLSTSDSVFSVIYSPLTNKYTTSGREFRSNETQFFAPKYGEERMPSISEGRDEFSIIFVFIIISHINSE